MPTIGAICLLVHVNWTNLFAVCTNMTHNVLTFSMFLLIHHPNK